MACDVSSLLSDACDNGFMPLAGDEQLSRAVILQLFYNAAGGTETESELLSQACDNGFWTIAQDEFMFRQILLQLLCDSSGG
jgi:hypothetical protein